MSYVRTYPTFISMDSTSCPSGDCDIWSILLSINFCPASVFKKVWILFSTSASAANSRNFCKIYSTLSLIYASFCVSIHIVFHANVYPKKVKSPSLKSSKPVECIYWGIRVERMSPRSYLSLLVWWLCIFFVKHHFLSYVAKFCNFYSKFHGNFCNKII